MIRSVLEPRFPHLRDLRPIYRQFRAGDARMSQADISKAERLLGYRPAWGVKQGLARAIEWYAVKLPPTRSIDGRVPVLEVALHGS
jgi:UDP-N-acetylglucosamine 4-epimerase